MEAAQRALPTVAPGQWTLCPNHGTNDDSTPVVYVSFSHARELPALRAQLQFWRESIKSVAAQMPVVLVPSTVVSANAERVLFAFPAPRHVGDKGLSDERSPLEVLDLLRRVAIALDELHAHHLTHGGLGLQSLWWMPDGALRMADVALAHFLSDIAEAPSRAAIYRAPELWRGRTVLPASDQYALAVIAFELFSGRELVTQHDESEVISLEPIVIETGARLYPGAPAALNEVMQRALSASPAARFENCVDFIEALSGHVTAVHSLPTLHQPVWQRGASSTRRDFGLAAVATVSIITAAFLLRDAMTETRAPMALSRVMPNLENVRLPGTAQGETLREAGMGLRVPGARPTTLPSSGSANGAIGGAGNTAGNGTATMVGQATVAGAVTSSARRTDASSAPSAAPSSAETIAIAAVRSGVTATSKGGTSVARSAASAVATALAPSAARDGFSARVADALSSIFGRSNSGAVAQSGSAAAGSTGGTPVVVTSARSSITSSEAVPTSSPSNMAQRRSSDSATNSATSAATVAPSGSPATAPASASSPALNAPAPTSAPTSAATSAMIVIGVPTTHRVYVDGVLTRPASGSLSLAPGSHDVDVVAPTGATVRRRITLRAGESYTVR